MPVKGHTNLVRDSRTGAILNTNKNEIQRSRKLKAVQQEKEQNITRLSEEVDTLRDDVKQIKDLLFRLVEGNHE
tara:strand:+ start:213 stop:434 length:222 start_codon:yes stop_codon:yes gene_type:complete